MKTIIIERIKIYKKHNENLKSFLKIDNNNLLLIEQTKQKIIINIETIKELKKLLEISQKLNK